MAARELELQAGGWSAVTVASPQLQYAKFFLFPTPVFILLGKNISLKPPGVSKEEKEGGKCREFEEEKRTEMRAVRRRGRCWDLLAWLLVLCAECACGRGKHNTGE